MGCISSLCALLFINTADVASGAPGATVDVKLPLGIFRGVATPGATDKFLGIPFALQPIGNLRFKAPIPMT